MVRVMVGLVMVMLMTGLVRVIFMVMVNWSWYAWPG